MPSINLVHVKTELYGVTKIAPQRYFFEIFQKLIYTLCMCKAGAISALS